MAMSVFKYCCPGIRIYVVFFCIAKDFRRKSSKLFWFEQIVCIFFAEEYYVNSFYSFI